MLKRAATRQTVQVAVATLVLGVLSGGSCTASAVAAPVKAHAATVHTATVSGTRLEIASTRLTQQADRLTWSVTLGQPRVNVNVDRAGGGRICAVFTGTGVATPLCVARSKSKWSATIAGRPAPGASVQLVATRALSVTLRLAALGLPPGTLHWAVQGREAGCTLGDATCSDRLPTRGHLHDTLWRPVAMGCTRVGAGQVTRGPASRKLIALTFDDGPSPYTAQIRAMLKREHAVATFFELGRSLGGQEAAARALIADGDEIGDHSWDHADLGGGGPGASSEISRTGTAIAAATGFSPCLFRPPYGATSGDLTSRANALGMTSVLWTVDTNDWQLPGAAAIESRVLSGVVPGAIVLMHDGGGPRSESVAALGAVLPVLRQRGYRFVTVSQLLGNTTTYGLVRPG